MKTYSFSKVCKCFSGILNNVVELDQAAIGKKINIQISIKKDITFIIIRN
ncbi:MAG: hypothetical protein LBQ88_05410 [Treponema sp.]|jgi:hypothetical protein|nr:hypothetical protein [Treponema sp.]